MAIADDVKADLRRHSLARRDLVSHQEAHDAAQQVCARALKLLLSLRPSLEGVVVSAYWPIRSELNTRPLLEALHGQRAAVALPVMTAVRRPLLFRAFDPFDDELVKGPFGLSEPASEKPELHPEIVFAPLAAFDRKGGRLGYGGGIYDATLHALRARRPVTAIGLAYALQEAELAPREAHDEPLDFVVTERETISFD
ncbi:MAG TPA: 5-formyltetrahydrofolate cyclo-ligase [Methylocystis sp.]|nr:5-formyltetrahydrofolate cyclo-ligase [Methylocystis sp.]